MRNNAPSESQIPTQYRNEGKDFLDSLHAKQGIQLSDKANSAAEHFGDSVNNSVGSQIVGDNSGQFASRADNPNLFAATAWNPATTEQPELTNAPTASNQTGQSAISTDQNSPDSNPSASSVSPDLPPPMSPNEQYLKEIETKDPEKKPFLNKKLIILFGGLVASLLVVFVISMVLNSAKQAPFKTALDVGSKMNNLQSLIEYGHDQEKNISQATTLKILNEVATILPSRQHELSEIFTLVADTKSGSKKNKKVEGPFVAELNSEMAAGNLNEAFKKELSEQMQDVISAVAKLRKETSNQKGKKVCEQTEKDLTELLVRLQE